jgi:hypothetical protein
MTGQSHRADPMLHRRRRRKQKNPPAPGRARTRGSSREHQKPASMRNHPVGEPRRQHEQGLGPEPAELPPEPNRGAAGLERLPAAWRGQVPALERGCRHGCAESARRPGGWHGPAPALERRGHHGDTCSERWPAGRHGPEPTLERSGRRGCTGLEHWPDGCQKPAPAPQRRGHHGGTDLERWPAGRYEQERVLGRDDDGDDDAALERGRGPAPAQRQDGRKEQMSAHDRHLWGPATVPGRGDQRPQRTPRPAAALPSPRTSTRSEWPWREAR